MSLARLRRMPEAPMIGLFAALFVAFGLIIPGFVASSTLSNILNRTVTVGIVACGLTLCVVAGQMDLSIASTIAVASVLYAKIQPEYGLVAGVLAAILAGAAVGALNGFLVTVVRIQAFIATLGTLLLVRGAAHLLSNGQPVTATALDAALAINKFLAGPVSYRLLVLLAIVVLTSFFLNRMRPGRDLLAIGGNQSAAAAAGIPINRRLFLVFVISGICAGVAGAELAVALMAGSPVIGDSTFLAAAAAVFLGGAALTGGRGTITASLLAALVLSTLAVGLELSFINAAYQRILTGVVLLIALSPIFTRQQTRQRRTQALG